MNEYKYINQCIFYLSKCTLKLIYLSISFRNSWWSKHLSYLKVSIIHTWRNPGTSSATTHLWPSCLTQVIRGNGVPLDWHMTSIPVVLEKSTWFGGSCMNTGPDVSACWASAMKWIMKLNYQLHRRLTFFINRSFI